VKVRVPSEEAVERGESIIAEVSLVLLISPSLRYVEL